MRAAALAALVPVVALVGAGCSGDPTPPAGAPLPVEAPVGERLCGSVPASSAVMVLGTVKFTHTGEVRRGRDSTVAAECLVSNTTRDRSEIVVLVRKGDDRTLAEASAAYTLPTVTYRYPADVAALGYAYGSPTKAHGVIVRGGHIVQVDLNLPARGRDALADVVVLTRQVADGLALPA